MGIFHSETKPCDAWALWRPRWFLRHATETVTNLGCSGKRVVLGASPHGGTETLGTSQHSCSLSCHVPADVPSTTAHTWDTLHMQNPPVRVGVPSWQQAPQSPKSSVDVQTPPWQHTPPGVQAPSVGTSPVHTPDLRVHVSSSKYVWM